MSGTVDQLTACRVLVAEDEFLIAAEITRALVRLGAEVIGPIASCEEALELLANSSIPVDLAVLDIHLADKPAYALAEALKLLGIPFVFATGFSPAAIPERYRQVPLWEKPYDENALAGMLVTLTTQAKRRE